MNKLLSNLIHNDMWVCAYLPVIVKEFKLWSIPYRRENCKTEVCEKVLVGFRDRHIRIIHDHDHFVVPFVEWCKLCHDCKMLVHGWYYKNLYPCESNDVLPFELFEIEIEKESAMDLWHYYIYIMHYSLHESVRDELENKLVTDVSDYLVDIVNRYKNKEQELMTTGKFRHRLEN